MMAEEAEQGTNAASMQDVTQDVAQGVAEPLSRRLSPTLARICKRRRTAIGLSLHQLSVVSGIDEALLAEFEEAEGASGISYDHAIVLRRVLGILAGEMPGMRPREILPDSETMLGQFAQSLLSGPLIAFDRQVGERFVGDFERAVTAPLFSVRIDDDSLEPDVRKGTLIAIRPGTEAEKGDLVLIRHRRDTIHGLRRFSTSHFVGLAAWQSNHPVDENWRIIGRAAAFLLPR
jgi:SOS-response transcriptional repressor LexA